MVQFLPAVKQLFSHSERGLVFIAGPCVIESEASLLRHAERLVAMAERLAAPLILKASFDKANRTRVSSFRGVGISEGMRCFEAVRLRFPQLSLLTDVHEAAQCAPVAAVVDVLQIPAFLCRQTDLIAAAAETGRPLNIKKGQFMAPEDMRFAVEKAREVNPAAMVSLVERGTTHGYHDLVVDMRSLITMRAFEPRVPIVFDATHSVQSPGGLGGVSGGNRLLALPLARAAAAVGVDALFAEVHEAPDLALSDGPNSLTFDQLEALIRQTSALHALNLTHL